MINIVGSFKLVFSKYQKQAFINQFGNREWVLLIEAICSIGEYLTLFVILIGKKWKDEQFTIELKLSDCISLNKNSWTNNKLYIK